MAAGAHGHFLRPADYGVDRDPAQGDCRRQRGDFKFDSLHRLRPAFIDSADGKRMSARWEVGRFNGEFQLVAADHRAHVGIDAQAGNGRLALGRDCANQRIAHHRVAGQPFNLQARRDDLYFKCSFNDRSLPAGVGGADAQRMLFRAQQEGIQIKVIGRLAVRFDHLAIHHELDLGDLSLAAGIHRNDLGIGDVNVRRRFKIIGDGRRQRGDLEFGTQLADIAFDILDGDIQLVFARLLRLRLNGVAFFGRYHFAVDGVFNALNILVRADLHRDLRIFGQGFVKDFSRQKEQRYRNGRAQGGGAG